MIVHRLKFKTCKVLEVQWIFVRFNKILLDAVFLGGTLYVYIAADLEMFENKIKWRSMTSMNLTSVLYVNGKVAVSIAMAFNIRPSHQPLTIVGFP